MGILGFAFDYGEEKLILMLAMQEADVIVYEALEAAGNAGQEAIIEPAMDPWREYIEECLDDGRPIDAEVLGSLCSHPEAIGEIIEDMVDKLSGVQEQMEAEQSAASGF